MIYLRAIACVFRCVFRCMCLSNSSFIYLSIYIFMSLFMYIFVDLSIYLFIYLSCYYSLGFRLLRFSIVFRWCLFAFRMQTLLCDYVDSAAEAFARCQSAVMVVIRVLPILERQDLESISSRRNPIRPIHGEMILHWMKLPVFHTLK